MSQYEGWTNIETFMVASIIDNDKKFLELIMDNVQNYMTQSMEHQLEKRLQFIIKPKMTPFRVGSSTVDMNDALIIRLRLNSELRNAIFAAFFDAVDWDELTEHYKTKYVENLVNDKDILEQIEKDKQSNFYKIAVENINQSLRTSSNEPNIANTGKDDSFPLPDYYGE